MTITELAEEALADICKQIRERRPVYASRKVIFAGTNHLYQGEVVGFRKVGEKIVMELWKANRSNPPEKFPLTPDCQKRAGEMLDSL